MKRTLLTSIILLLMSTSVHCQKVHDTVFMDAKWNECSRENFTYFRIKTSTKDGYFLKAYYKSGQLQMEGYFLKGETIIPDGPAKYYYENGNIMEAYNYTEGKRDGEYKKYYKSGMLHFFHYYSNGMLQGKRMVYYENGCLKREESYEDNKLTSSTCYKTDGSPDAYTPFIQDPEYIGGEEARIQFLIDNIIYPRKARRRLIMGLVYLTFVVSENGDVEGVEVFKGAHPLLDAEALRVVKNMPSWIPGKIDGENDHIRCYMPVKFTLAN
ncbi:MAG: TonB family protein [Bacteroidales bacterium]|nr:TonB family protein [Bacteroidales bacterium]